MRKIICVLFHRIETHNNCLFIDQVDGMGVGQYECKKCNTIFMANSKRSFFRVTLNPNKMNNNEQPKEELNPIKPYELMLGNFISCFGDIVMVKGITPREDGSFYISHTGSKDLFIGDGIEFDAYPVVLTNKWKVAMKIDKASLPEWVKYVHQAQNFMFSSMRTNLLEIIDYSLVPAKQDLTLETE